MKHRLILIAALMTLAACTEKPQTLNSSGTKLDAPAFQGTGMAFTVPDWKPGDKTSWEAQLKTRTQNQNEYTKVN
jgi:uncharacterized lipoprotein YajG